MRRTAVALVVLAAAIGLVSGRSLAAGHVTTLIQFNAAAGELPEGIAVDKRGTIYITVPPLGELRAIDDDGSQSVVATLPVGTGLGPLGLAVDAPGNVYVAVATFDPATSGVYRLSRDGAVERLPGTGQIAMPNGLALDARGTLYVSDSVQGAIWRVPRGAPAEIWLDDAVLAGDGSGPLPFPIGANGVAIYHRTLYVTNTEMSRLIGVPILPNGDAGEPEIVAQSPQLDGADGLAVDVHGSLYVPVIAQSTIVRVDLDGTITTLATETDGLDFPSSVAFGTGRGERQTLFAVNYAIGAMLGAPPGHGPALLAIATDVPGLPLP